MSTNKKKADLAGIREAVTKLENAETYGEQIAAAIGVLSRLEEAGLVFAPVGQDPRDVAQYIDVACPTNAIRLLNDAMGDTSLYSVALDAYDGYTVYNEVDVDACACGPDGCLWDDSEADS